MSNLSKEYMLRIGTILHDSYRIERHLSSGGFGNTYMATSIAFNEQIAIKEFFMSDLCTRSDNGLAVVISGSCNGKAIFASQLGKFKKEAKRLRKLHNDNIVQVYDFFEENETAYYVMDYIEGESLSDKIKKSRQAMTENMVTTILLQVLNALDAAHKEGIWHLDLKPANIMLDKHDNVKVIDFGASKQQNFEWGGATRSTTSIAYTIGYAPIEQIEQNFPDIGPWTDFYALGATLYTLLTNQKPPLPSRIRQDHSTDKHSVLIWAQGISVSMKKLIIWMMEYDPKDRPKSVEEIYLFLQGKVTTKSNATDDATRLNVRGKSHETTYKEERRQGGKRALVVISVVGIILATILVSKAKDRVANISSQNDNSKSIVSYGSQVTRLQCHAVQGNCLYTGTINRDSIPDGYGEAWFSDGRYYKGCFRNGMMVADDAIFRYSNGDTYRGSFEDDHFANGRYTINEDKSYFIGSYDEQGQPKKGAWYDKYGKKIQDI